MDPVTKRWPTCEHCGVNRAFRCIHCGIKVCHDCVNTCISADVESRHEDMEMYNRRKEDEKMLKRYGL